MILLKQGRVARHSFTRPNNTTAYDAGDVINTLTSSPVNQKFENIGAEGDLLEVLGIKLKIYKAGTNLAVPSGMTTFKLHLYSLAPTAIADGAAQAFPAADALNYEDTIAMSVVMVDKGDFLFAAEDSINKFIGLKGPHLYYMLETVGGYAPIAQTIFETEIGYAIV